jgi:YesN/AraC family two-component response regulator
MKEFIIDNLLSRMPEERIVVGNDLSLATYKGGEPMNCSPEKYEHAAIIVCTAGHCNLKINLENYEVEAPSLITIMPGQIVEPMAASQNFSAIIIALSKRFIDMINLPGWQQNYLQMYNHPAQPLDERQVNAMRFFFTVLHHAASDEDNPFRLQVIENMIRVFYYGGVSRMRQHDTNTSTYKNGIVERFMDLVREHYREERLIGFYADKLCITPKYLSKVVKEHTGRSAGEWIERHVILEARAMLQSSDMTIQQISASLNFPNQSFFGKYFKRATGLSPKQYRNKR